MPGRPQSDTKKAQIFTEMKAELQAEVVQIYKEELLKKAAGLESRGARAVCRQFEKDYSAEHGKDIHFNHCTIINHAKGRSTRAESNAAKSWLTAVEADVVIEFIVEMGNRGFPLSHKRLKEHVDDILQARLGDRFRANGVGKQWTARFIEKYSNRIMMARSAPLEEKRGRAVNKNTNRAWFELLGGMVTKYDISEELTWGTDEIGVTGTSGQSERVMGGRRKGPHYQQIGGSRENTTVIVTICADGTSTAPAIIFKGQAFQAKWRQDNPADAQ